jgi:hypothetical protein
MGDPWELTSDVSLLFTKGASLQARLAPLRKGRGAP